MWEVVPAPVRAVPESLAAAGHEAVLVGGCVRALARGDAVRDWDVACSASPEEILAHFPRAIPIGRRFGTAMVPTEAGPVDVTPFRGEGGLRGDLALRDFTINAVALRPACAGLFDPFGGLADLDAGRLRAVGDARARLAEDPLRALRAARLAAALALCADPELERAMAERPTQLAGVAGERIRFEIERLLQARQPARGIALLRRTGLESHLFPGACEDAAAVVECLPRDPTLRLAAWLRGTNVARSLVRLRTSRSQARDVEILLAHHPVDESTPATGPALRRLLKRVGEPNLERLFQLREAEQAARPLPPEVGVRLSALRETVARLRAAGTLAVARLDLALGGREVMAALGCGPGPRVGRALRHLTECVIEDPSRNDEAQLRELLRDWAARNP